MDDLQLMRDFRGAVAPPDGVVLTRARARMLGPAARRGPRLRLVSLAAAAATLAAAAAVAVPALLPSGTSGRLVGQAWAVEQNQDGTVSITVTREMADPVGLQRALRQDGILAFVDLRLTGEEEWCISHYLHPASDAVQAAVLTMPGMRHAGPFDPRWLSTDAKLWRWTVNPRAMPKGSSLYINVTFLTSPYAYITGQPLVLTTDVRPTCPPGSPYGTAP